MKFPTLAFALVAVALAVCPRAAAVVLPLGNDPNLNGGVDGWSSIMVVDETETYTNTSALTELVTPIGFDVQIGSNRGRVTPFLVKVNGDNSFTVLAVGETRVSGVDYPSTGVFEYAFEAAPEVIELAPGESIAPGFTDANANGSGNAGSVVPFSNGGSQIWLTGGGSTSSAGSVTVGAAPGAGGSTLTHLFRRYAFAIDIDVSPGAIEPPTDILYTGGGPVAGSPAGAALGWFAAVDPDPIDTHTFSLISNPGGRYSIVGDRLQTAIPAGVSGSSTTVRVRVEDSVGNDFEKDFVISVEGQQAPTAVTLDVTEVNRLASAVAAVGTLGAVDGNAGDGFSFALVAGAGDADNALFVIDGEILEIATPIPEGRTDVSLRVRATDYGGNPVESSFVLAVVDPALRLNEILASGGGGLADEDGDTPDWFEVYNAGGSTVNLAGWTVSDDNDDLLRWEFPAVDIAPGDYLVVFASGKDRAVAGAELHTNFQLGATGEDLLLVAPGGVVLVDEYDGVPDQFPGISYGVGDDGMTRGFLTPTPGAANGSAFAEASDEVTFSQTRGSYAASFALTLSSPAGTGILYTLDGSKPAAGSALTYSAPITVTPPTSGSERGVRTVRALVTGGTGLRTPVATHTYLFVDQAKLQSVLSTAITSNPTYGSLIDDALLAHPVVSITKAGGLPGGTEVETSIEMFDPDGVETGFQIDCGIKVVGGHSVGSAKNNFRLYFRGEYGATKLNYPLFTGHPYSDGAAESFDRLNLRSGSHDSFFWLANPGNPSNSGGPAKGDAQYIRNRWINDMMFRMGHAALHGRWAQVFINGSYHGQYQILEFPNDDFHASYLGGDPEDYEFTNGANASKTGSDNWPAIWSGVKAAANAGGAAAAEWIDFENLADYMLLNFYAGNPWDWNPNQNWMAGGPNSAGAGGWKFYCWDADIIFQDPGANVMGKNVPDGLFAAIRDDPEFEIVFRDRAYAHCFHDGVLTPGEARLAFDARAAEIEVGIVTETARWQGSAANPPWDRDDEWDSELTRMRTTFFPNRHNTLMSQLRGQGWYPVEAPEFVLRGGEVATGYQPVITAPSGTIYYTTDGSDPRAAGGGASASASVYAGGAITVNAPTLVQTRALSGGEWSAVNAASYVLTGTVPAAFGNVVISEIYYNPPGPAEDDEFIELLNIAPVPVDLSGARFAAGITYEFPLGSVLLPGERWVLSHGTYEGSLTNSGETVTLLADDDSVISSFRYNDKFPWPEAADGAGFSLVYVSGDPAVAENWRSSAAAGGTPGGSDATVFLGGDLVDYATGGRPLELGIVDGQWLVSVHHRVAADDIQLVLESSVNLTDWSADGTVVDEGAPDLEGISVRLVSGAVVEDRQFLRLKIVE